MVNLSPEITLEAVLAGRNVDGEIYLSDVDLWLGADMATAKRVHKKLNELVKNKLI